MTGPAERRTQRLVQRVTHRSNEFSVRLAAAAIRYARIVDQEDTAFNRHLLRRTVDALRACGPEPGVLDDLGVRIAEKQLPDAPGPETRSPD